MNKIRSREEAIAILKGLWTYLQEDIRQALEMAIKALEQEPKYCDRNICMANEYNGIGCDECEVTKSQEPSGDLIQRQAVIDTIDKWVKSMHVLVVFPANEVTPLFDSIHDLPPVNPQPCEDAISRQAVLSMQYRIDDSATLSTRDVVNVDDIEDLPSVKPQEPTDENLHREREQAYMQGYEDASKRFRQEPCEDAISREDVINLKWQGETSEEFLEGYASAIEDARALPSVIPQPKTGHWINISNKDLHDYRTGNKLCFECSECRSQYTYKSNYCPNCGMVEPQKSEEVNG